MQEDSQEMHNLYGKPEYKEVARELLEELQRLQKQYDDPIEAELAEKK